MIAPWAAVTQVSMTFGGLAALDEVRPDRRAGRGRLQDDIEIELSVYGPEGDLSHQNRCGDSREIEFHIEPVALNEPGAVQHVEPLVRAVAVQEHSEGPIG
jgi:hypothetical protein